MKPAHPPLNYPREIAKAPKLIVKLHASVAATSEQVIPTTEEIVQQVHQRRNFVVNAAFPLLYTLQKLLEQMLRLLLQLQMLRLLQEETTCCPLGETKEINMTVISGTQAIPERREVCNALFTSILL